MSDKLINWNYDLTFQKLGGSNDNVMYIAGEASNPDKDEDNENMDMSSLKSAFVDYMKNPIIKFMHDKAPQHMGAIGVVVEKYVDSSGKEYNTSFGDKPFLVAKFEKDTMPNWMWNAIQKKVYRGFSIGGKALKKINGTIFVKSWLETSVVDVPSAKGSFFSILKMACSGDDCPYNQDNDIPDAESNEDPKETPIRATTEVSEERTERSKKIDTWYNLIELKSFIKEFPKASINDMSEKMGFEVDYIKQLLEKLESLTKTPQTPELLKTPGLDGYLEEADMLKTPSIDQFLKGGVGSGQKGHTTAKQEGPGRAGAREGSIPKKIHTKDMLGRAAVSVISDPSDLEEMIIFPPNHAFKDSELKALLGRDGLSQVGNQIAVDLDSYDDAFGDSDPMVAYAYDDEGKSTAPGEGSVATEAKGISDDTSNLNMKDTIFFPQATRFDDATLKKIKKDVVSAEGHFAMSNESYKTHFGDTDPLGILE